MTKRAIKRTRSITLLGITIKFYNYGEEYDIQWVNYHRAYDSRVSIEQMIKDADNSVNGKLYIYSARVDTFLALPVDDLECKSAYSVKANSFAVPVPVYHQFDGEINIK